MENKCSKCGGKMTEGFILDRGGYDYKRPQSWIAGKPESSFWSGLKTSDRNAFIVSALRCDGCGFLEFYATEKTDVDSSLFSF